MPRRIQRRRTKGWRKPAGTVNVTRPGKWGNPFRLSEYLSLALPRFRIYLREETAAGRLDLEELTGKDLMCWCPVSSPCHGDILLEEANR